MKRLVINKLTILSKDKNKGNQFVFNDGINLILSDKNSAGKTTLLNLIYSALGCVVKFKDEWINSFIRLDISIGNESYTLYKTPNGIYFIQDSKQLKEYTKESEYHEEIANILGYRIYLKDHKGKLKITRPAHFLLISYISQVKGWSSFFPSSFEKLGEFKSFQADLVEQFCKVKSNKELENQEELKSVRDNLEKVNNEKNVLLVTKEDLNINSKYDLKELKQIVKDYENTLNSLQEELSDLVTERQFLQNEISLSILIANDVDADYQKARESASKIECPYCGTVHSNTIIEKSELFFLKTKLEDERISQESRIKEINSGIQEIESKIIELTELRNDVSSLISDNTEKFIKAITYRGLSTILIDLDEQIISLEERKKRIISIQNKNRKEYKEHKKSVNEFFLSKLKDYADKLSITFENYDNIKKVTDYQKILNSVKGGAADSNRVILAYYLAIYATAINYESEIIPPLVIDTPNQNEQDKENYKAIMDTLIHEENKQIIICSIKSEYTDSLDNVNRIIVNRLMKDYNYKDSFSAIFESF